MKKSILKLLAVCLVISMVMSPTLYVSAITKEANIAVNPDDDTLTLPKPNKSVASTTYPLTIKIDQPTITVVQGQEFTLKATLTYPNGVTNASPDTYDHNVDWYFSQNGIVSKSGSATSTFTTNTQKFRADFSGNIDIIASTNNALSDRCHVYVLLPTPIPKPTAAPTATPKPTGTPTPTLTPTPIYPLTIFKFQNFNTVLTNITSIGNYDNGTYANGFGSGGIGSLKIAPGYRVTLCNDYDFRGSCIIFQDCFSSSQIYEVPDLYAINWGGGIAKSLILEKISNDPIYPVVYADSGYRGASQTLTKSEYRMSELTVGNDKISSIKVPPGYKVWLYENDGFGGAVEMKQFSRPFIGTFNDKTSSIKIGPSYP